MAGRLARRSAATKLAAAAIGACGWAASGWGAAQAADAAAGARVAAQWCANCHVVAAGQTAGADPAPSLVALMRDPSWDDAALVRAIADPHPRMPDPGLTRDQIADVVAYLTTLRP
jgi:mono/diheme cytochrome c family protein